MAKDDIFYVSKSRKIINCLPNAFFLIQRYNVKYKFMKKAIELWKDKRMIIVNIV